MIKYKNGRPVADGDLVIGPSSNLVTTIAGTVVRSSDNQDGYNITVFSFSTNKPENARGVVAIVGTVEGENLAMATVGEACNSGDFLRSDDALNNLQALGGCPPWWADPKFVFKVGDNVRLVSGGPDMTITELKGCMVACGYYDEGGAVHNDEFDLATIVPFPLPGSQAAPSLADVPPVPVGTEPVKAAEAAPETAAAV